MVDYEPYPAATVPTISKEFKFTIIDPCLTSLIIATPTQFQNLVGFAGYKITSLEKYNFDDTESTIRTLSSDASDFCGNKLLSASINGTATQWFKLKNHD